MSDRGPGIARRVYCYRCCREHFTESLYCPTCQLILFGKVAT